MHLSHMAGSALRELAILPPPCLTWRLKIRNGSGSNIRTLQSQRATCRFRSTPHANLLAARPDCRRRASDITRSPSRRGGTETAAEPSGTFYESSRLVGGADEGTIAMRTKYFAGIMIAALAVGTRLGVNSVGPLPSEDQSTQAMQVAHRLAESVGPFLG